MVAGSPRDYRDAHPSTALLVVEVADASLGFDRTVKAGLYARVGIQEYWVVNLIDGVLEVHRDVDRSGSRYATVEGYGVGQQVAPLASRKHHSIAIKDLLP